MLVNDLLPVPRKSIKPLLNIKEQYPIILFISPSFGGVWGGRSSFGGVWGGRF